MVCLVWFLGATLACAQTDSPTPTRDAEDLGAKSVPMRTALYHDPTLEAPLDRLLQMYREANRAKELLDLYRAHVAQYPADTGSQIVLLRLLLAAGEPEAGPRIKAAAQQFPDVGYLQYLLFKQFQSSQPVEALAALDRAIDKETLPARKRSWTEQLIPRAMTLSRGDLAEKHLRAWAARGTTPDEKLEAARVMIANRFFKPSLETLDAAEKLSPSAETGVEIQMTAATAEVGLNEGDAAAARLDKLLSRLTADYWRRTEILRRRTALVKSDAQRQTMLAAARKRVQDTPHDEAAVLDLAQLLDSFEFRREALAALLAAGNQLAVSEKVERATLDLLDRLRDERQREEYLSARIKAQPQRQDLVALRIRTLFLLARRQEALAALDALAQGMDPATRINYLLELARALRKSSLAADATEVFERVVKLAPDRYEVRRELAETYLALGKNDKARALFAAGPPADVPAENLGDVIQFMGKQGLLVEAKDTVAKRLAADPQNFDLSLLALELEGKLGNQAAGEVLLDKTRALADTGARYRRWLEAAAAFSEVFDAKGAFFQAEATRLPQPTQGWTKEDLERRMAFADLAARNERKEDAEKMLRDDLAGTLPAEMRVELRRRLVALMETDPARAVAVEEQLKALAKDDPAQADEYRVKQAIAFQRAQRMDQAMIALGMDGGKPLKDSIDLSKLTDPLLLAGLENMLKETSSDPKANTAILQRQTELDPTNRAAWERWIMALAVGGDEALLRQTLRRLLAGIDRLPISADTKDLLQRQLCASQWRSIHTLLNDKNTADAALSDALASLDAADQLSQERISALWVNWTRAYLLNRLARYDARDQAIAELTRMVSERAPQPASAAMVPGATAAPVNPPDAMSTPTKDDVPRIVFPDGLSIALPAARELLTAKPQLEPTPLRISRTGPLGTLNARWAFEPDRHSTIVQILPLEGAHTLVTDQGGKMYCLDAKTGKLLWSHTGPAALTPQQQQNNVYYGNITQQVAFPKASSDGAGRILIPAANQVECISSATGDLLWRAELSPGKAAFAIFPVVECRGEKIIACEPAVGRVWAFDRATGKLLWDRSIPMEAAKNASSLHAMNSGANFSGRKLFIYGAKTAVIDTETGDADWIFDPDSVRELPISLKETDTAPPVAVAAPTAPAFGGSRLFSRGRMMGGWGGGGGGSSAFSTMAMNYIRSAGNPIYPGMSVFGRGSGFSQVQLAAPAAAWAALDPQTMQTRFGIVDRDRLLLFSYQEIRVIRLNLPFRSESINVQGVFAGMSGNVACVLNQGGLALADTVTGSTANFELRGAARATQDDGEEEEMVQGATPGPRFRVQAAIDGPLVYLSYPAGITCVNAQTAEAVFTAPWPKNVAPAPVEKPVGQSQPPQYMWNGVSTYGGQQWGPAFPLVDRVQDGMLLATVSPGRVVALEQASAK